MYKEHDFLTWRCKLVLTDIYKQSISIQLNLGNMHLEFLIFSARIFHHP